MHETLTKENLFEALITHHCSNLKASLPYYQNSQIHDTHGKPLHEGRSENPHYNGLFLLYDGDTILDKAQTMILRKRTGIRETTETPYFRDLAHLLQTDADPDCTYLLNTAKHKVTKVKGELKNYAPGDEDIESILEQCLPANFLSADNSTPVYNAGNKTAIAVMTARTLNRSEYFPESQNDEVRSIVIKKTAYGSLGMGKLAEFGKDGLTREFYFEHNPNHTGPFIDEEHHIVGVYKQYAHPHAEPIIQYISNPTQRALHKTSPGTYSTTPTDAISMQPTL